MGEAVSPSPPLPAFSCRDLAPCEQEAKHHRPPASYRPAPAGPHGWQQRGHARRLTGRCGMEAAGPPREAAARCSSPGQPARPRGRRAGRDLPEPPLARHRPEKRGRRPPGPGRRLSWGTNRGSGQTPPEPCPQPGDEGTQWLRSRLPAPPGKVSRQHSQRLSAVLGSFPCHREGSIRAMSPAKDTTGPEGARGRGSAPAEATSPVSRRCQGRLAGVPRGSHRPCR